MSAEIYVSTRTALHPAGTAVQSVTVALYTDAGAFVSTGVTDALGNVFLGDRAAGDYELRITVPAPGYTVTGSNRHAITVVDGAALAFDLVVSTSALPTAGLAYMCRCSGTFVDATGAPAVGLVLTFSRIDGTPYLYQNVGDTTAIGVAAGAVSVTTDVTGYASIDLPREAHFTVHIAQHGHQIWTFIVPDLAAAPLPDVVFPHPSTVEYKEAAVLLVPAAAPAMAVTQGLTKEIDLVTIMRSGLRLTGLRALTLQADTGHWRVRLTITNHQLVVEGLSPGVVNLTVALVNPDVLGCTPRVYPSQTFLGNLIITVADDAGIVDLVDPADGSLGVLLSDTAA